MDASERAARRGVYGLRVTGLDDAAGLLNVAPPDWPEFGVERCIDPRDPAPEVQGIHERFALLPLLPEGRLAVDRDRATARFTTTAALSDAAVVHPYLAPVAAIAAAWEGGVGFHGGGFVVDGGAWLVLADAASGKSSLLAVLHARGVPIVADDLVIVRDGKVLAGPRCIDLRRDAASRLGMGWAIGVAGGRERWRIRTASVEPELPVRGFVDLRWGDVAVDDVDASDRLATLARNLAVVRTAHDRGRLLEFVGLPMVRFTRPRDFARIRTSAAELLAGVEERGTEIVASGQETALSVVVQ